MRVASAYCVTTSLFADADSAWVRSHPHETLMSGGQACVIAGACAGDDGGNRAALVLL